MAEKIRIEMASEREGADLVDALAVRGLVGELVSSERAWEVELGSAHEPTERLLAETEAALESWLADRRLESIRVRVGGRSSVVTPPAPLGAAAAAP